jgi:hypothetical protein
MKRAKRAQVKTSLVQVAKRTMNRMKVMGSGNMPRRWAGKSSKRRQGLEMERRPASLSWVHRYGLSWVRKGGATRDSTGRWGNEFARRCEDL